MTDVQRLLDALHAAGVNFVVVGGVALVLRGSSRVTLDLDLCYARDLENLRRLEAHLGERANAARQTARSRGTPLLRHAAA